MADLLLPAISAHVPDEGVPIGEAARLTGVGIEALRF